MPKPFQPPVAASTSRTPAPRSRWGRGLPLTLVLLCGSGWAQAQQYLATMTFDSANISGGLACNYLYVDPIGHRLYGQTVVQGSPYFYSFDSSTGKLLNTFITNAKGGHQAPAPAVNPITNVVYVSDGWNVWAINNNTNTVSPCIMPSGSGQIDHLLVDESKNILYVFSYTYFCQFDGNTNLLISSVPKTEIMNPVIENIFLDPIRHVFYCGSPSGVYQLNEADFSLLQTIDVDATAMSFNPVSNTIFSANANGLYALNCSTDQVTQIQAPTLSCDVIPNLVTNQILCNSQNPVVVDGATNLATLLSGPVPGFYFFIPARGNPWTNQVPIFVQSRTSGIADGCFWDGDSETFQQFWPTMDSANTWYNPTLDPFTNRVFLSELGSDFTVIDMNKELTTAVGTGTSPSALALDPVAGLVYVANAGNALTASNTVTVIQTASASSGNPSTAVVTVGRAPSAVAADPVACLAYVVSALDQTVTVIDGATLATTTVPVGKGASAVAVDTATGMAYVTNTVDGTVTVIHGTAGGAATLAVGRGPGAVAVDEGLDLVYVANGPDGTGSVINGANLAVTPVTVGMNPSALLVNPGSHHVYVANTAGNTLTVLNGTSVLATVPVGDGPAALALNAMVDRVYSANLDSTVTLYDEPSGSTVNVPVQGGTGAIAVDSLTNRIYVANPYADTVTMIEGLTNATRPVAVGLGPGALVADPAGNAVYVANAAAGTVTVVSQDRVANPFTLSPAGVQDAQTVSNGNLFATTNARPAFAVQVQTRYSTLPGYAGMSNLSDPPPSALYYGVDNPQQWSAVSNPPGPNPATFQVPPVQPLSPGMHTLYLTAGFGMEASATDPGTPNYGIPVPVFSQIQALPFVVLPTQDRTSVQLTADVNPQAVAGTVTFTAVLSPSYLLSAAGPTGSVIFIADGNSLGSAPLVLSQGVYSATLATTALAGGSHRIHAIYNGDSNYSGSLSAILSEQIYGAPASIATVSGAGQSALLGSAFTAPLVAQVLDANGTPVPGVTVTFSGTGLGFPGGASAATGSTGQVSVTAEPTASGALTAQAAATGVSAPASFAETGLTGSPALVRVVSGSGQTAAPGSAFGSPLVAQVLDASGNPVPNVTVTFAGTGVSFAPAASVVTNGSGQASVTATSASGSAVTVTASVSGVATPAAFVEDEVAGSPASIQVVSGSGQSAAAGAAFASPLVVLVLDGNSVPVPNATVTFAGSGVSFAPAASVVTNGSGQASVTATSASGSAVTLTASVSGVVTPAVFSEDAAAQADSALLTFQASPATVFLGGGTLLSWTSAGSPSISLGGIGTQSGSSLWVTPKACTTYSLDDTQGDQLQATVSVRSFTLADLAGLAQAWGSSSGGAAYDARYDLNGDGKIDDSDVALCLGSL